MRYSILIVCVFGCTSNDKLNFAILLLIGITFISLLFIFTDVSCLFWYVNITSNKGFLNVSISIFNFFTNISTGYGWYVKSSNNCSFILLRNSLKVSSGVIFPLKTILLTNIPNILFVSFLFLFAIGLPIFMSSCPVYLYNNIKNADTKNIYGDTSIFLAYLSIFLKLFSSIIFVIVFPL